MEVVCVAEPLARHQYLSKRLNAFKASAAQLVFALSANSY
jgi:hypothetical protein